MKNTIFIVASFLVITACQNQLEKYPNTQEDYIIIPKPQTLQIQDGRFSINNETKNSIDEGLALEGAYLAELLSMVGGHTITFDSNRNGIYLSKE